jgi:4-amino-4-deoxy-L-arabinose transferase-like glycosyltransferase
MPALFVLLGLGMLSHQGLLGVDIMEARNLITAREMIETGHWFLPTLHGEPRLAKPPLPTWLTAWAMLLGNAGLDTDLVVNRIPSTLAGLLLAASLFGLTRQWTRSTEAAAWSTAFLATSYMFVLMARRNSWDIYCHAFMLAAIWGMSVIAGSSTPRKRLAVATGLLLGLSGLSKGPVGYYALLLPFVAALLLSGGWAGVRARIQDLGLVLGLGVAVSASWFAAAWLIAPHDVSSMLAQEQHAWQTAHTKPFWFYLQFPLITGIWSLLACAALWAPHARKRVEPLLPYWRPATWAIGSVLLLMLVPEKKDRYLLPVLIPLCQLMGLYLTGLLRDPEQGGRFGRTLILLNTLLFGALSLAVPVILWWWGERFPALSGLTSLEVGMAAALCAVLMYRLHRFRELRGLFALKFSLLGLLILGLPALIQAPAGDMSVPLQEIRAFTAGATVVCDSSLKFQDAWIIGSKPRRVAASQEPNLPDAVIFVSRDSVSVLPDALRGYQPWGRLDVTDFAGQTLHLLALRNTRITDPAPAFSHKGSSI